jgi:hypothetical protein
MPAWITGLLVLGEFCLLVALEVRQPLRQSAESKLTRVARNLALSSSSALAVQFAESPVVQPLSIIVERRKLGLLKRLPLPSPVEIALAAVLMDYTLYIWHAYASFRAYMAVSSAASHGSRPRRFDCFTLSFQRARPFRALARGSSPGDRSLSCGAFYLAEGSYVFDSFSQL